LTKGILYSFGPFLLNPEQMVLSVDGNIVTVPLKALKTLLTLIEHDREVVSKQVLIEAVWPDSYVEEGNLTQNIFLLRRQLGKAPEGQDYIETVPRRGYRLTVPVRKVPAPVVEGLGDKEVSGPQRLGEDLDLEAQPEAPWNGKTRRGVLQRRLWIAAPVLVLALLSWVAVEQWQELSYRPKFSGFSQITHDGLSKRIPMGQRGGPDAAIVSDGNRVYFSEGTTDASTEDPAANYRARRSREHSSLLLAYARSPASCNNSGKSCPLDLAWLRYWSALAIDSQHIKQEEALQGPLHSTVCSQPDDSFSPLPSSHSEPILPQKRL
jgi:DNA-binding winged helix-turn-helix (wHTH) protein